MNFSRQKAWPSVQTTPVTQNDDDNWKQMEKIFVKVERGTQVLEAICVNSSVSFHAGPLVTLTVGPIIIALTHAI
jgi:hypothetical protein